MWAFIFEVPLVTFPGLVHIWVAIATAVLGGTGCGNQGGVHHCAGLEHQAILGQGGVDGGWPVAGCSACSLRANDGISE